MKYDFCVMTAKGHYVEVQNVDVRHKNLAGVLCNLLEEWDYLPTEVEGEQLADWTKLELVIRRK